jgi:hypothetical protein
MSTAPPRHLQNLSHKGGGQGSALSMADRRFKGIEANSLNVNFSTQKAPEKSYTAETAFVEYKNGEVQFIFAQYDLLGIKLDSAISLKMHGFWAKQFLRSIANLENPSIEDIARDVQIKRDPIGKIDHNPGHVAKLSANIIQAAVSGFDTGLDFFYLSPISLSKGKGNKKEPVELIGIVRVDIRTALFLSIIDILRELEPNFPEVHEGSSPPRSHYG